MSTRPLDKKIATAVASEHLLDLRFYGKQKERLGGATMLAALGAIVGFALVMAGFGSTLINPLSGSAIGLLWGQRFIKQY